MKLNTDKMILILKKEINKQEARILDIQLQDSPGYLLHARGPKAVITFCRQLITMLEDTEPQD